MLHIRSSFQATIFRFSFYSLLSAGIISSPVLAQETLSFADEVVCAVPRIALPDSLKVVPDPASEDEAEADLTTDVEITEAENDQSDEALPMLGFVTDLGAKTEKEPDPSDAEILIEGDDMDVVDQNQVVLTGSAQVVQGGRGVFADKIVYEQDSYQALAKGNVRYYTQQGDEITTDSMRVEVDTFIGETEAAKMRVASRKGPAPRYKRNYIETYAPFAPITNRLIYEAERDAAQAAEAEATGPLVENRITADKIEIEGVDFQRLHNARVTRCPEGEDVLITGKEVELDHIEGVGRAKHVTVRFMGLPLLYAPRFSFPLNDERKTGFLAPSIGDDDVSGTIVSVPYYLNLAPKTDATLRATHYENRGTQIFGELRYLNEYGDGSLRAEQLQGDEVFNDENRYAYGLDLRQNYSNGWGLNIDLQDVSDTSYLNDFRNDINITSTTHLPQTLQLNYGGSALYLRAKASKYTAVTPDLNSSNPYDRLPQVAFGIRSQDYGPFEFALDSEYVDFEHDEEAIISGSRLNVTPSIGLPIEPIYGYLKPKLSFRTINYQLDNVQAGDEDSPSAAAPIFSVDSGIFLERNISLGNKEFVHSLEPRAMYVYIPEEDQSDFPLFDTGSGSVNSYNVLFREERLFGGDRIGDDHHVAVGVTTRLIDDETGDERLRASIGQLYYLEDRVVGLSADAEPETESSSDVFAEFDAKLNSEFKVNSFIRYSQEEKDFENMSVGLEYRSGKRRFASLDYFKNLDTSEDLHLEVDWPLSPRYQFSSNQRYSIEDSELRASSYGLVYDGCCWAIGLKFSQWIQSDGVERETILATLELDGLGSIRTSQ